MEFLAYVFAGALAIALAVAFMLYLAAVLSEEPSDKRMMAIVRRQPDFDPDYEYYGVAYGIAVDDSRGKVILLNPGDSPRVLCHVDIIASEIAEDRHIVTKAVRSSQLTGALVGGVAFGGVGAVVGALTGDRIEQGKVSEIVLRLTINDPAEPLHEITFLSSETDRDSNNYRTAIRSAREWQARIAVLIKRADSEDSNTTLATTSTEATTTSKPEITLPFDELKKLGELRAAGVLTEAEFAALKARLLA